MQASIRGLSVVPYQQDCVYYDNPVSVVGQPSYCEKLQAWMHNQYWIFQSRYSSGRARVLIGIPGSLEEIQLESAHAALREGHVIEGGRYFQARCGFAVM